MKTDCFGDKCPAEVKSLFSTTDIRHRVNKNKLSPGFESVGGLYILPFLRRVGKQLPNVNIRLSKGNLELVRRIFAKIDIECFIQNLSTCPNSFLNHATVTFVVHTGGPADIFDTLLTDVTTFYFHHCYVYYHSYHRFSGKYCFMCCRVYFLTTNMNSRIFVKFMRICLECFFLQTYCNVYRSFLIILV